MPGIDPKVVALARKKLLQNLGLNDKQINEIIHFEIKRIIEKQNKQNI